MSHMQQETYIRIGFLPLLHHPDMFLCLPLYALECLVFTLNHAAQINRNTHAQVISSCCNTFVYTTLKTKLSPQLNFFHWVAYPQLNIYNECVQCTHTPQMSQRTIQSLKVEWVTSKNFHVLGMFKLIVLPTSTNDPPVFLSHRTIICKLVRYDLPHPVIKGERTTQVTWSVFYPFKFIVENSWSNSLLNPFIS